MKLWPPAFLSRITCVKNLVAHCCGRAIVHQFIMSELRYSWCLDQNPAGLGWFARLSFLLCSTLLVYNFQSQRQREVLLSAGTAH